MDFEEKYYRFNYIFLSSIGLWPYDNSSIKQIQVILSVLIYISFLTAQLIKLFASEYSLDLLLEVLAFDFLVLIWFIKYITVSSVTENIKQLRKRVRSNWSILVDNHEIDTMHKYANIGRQSTIGIAICVYFGIFAIIFIYMPELFYIGMPLNESRPRILLHQAKYFDKYFYVVITHETIGLFLSATTGIAAESFSLINALHAFGMFKIASYRMEHMLNVDVSRISAAKGYIMFHDKIAAAVDIHIRALEISELLKSSFGISYLFMIIAAICSATVSLFRLYRIITMEQERIEIIKLFCYVVFLALFLVAGNFVGQEFINHDDHVHRMICNTKWYNAPLKVQKLILFLIRKTIKSYKVDAAGMFSPCLEGLAAAMSLLLSFLTILCSI